MRKFFIMSLICISAWIMQTPAAEALDLSSMASQQGLTGQDYDNGAYVPFFSHYKDWSTGLFLTNLGTSEGFFTIAVWDEFGNPKGKGTFRVAPNASRTGTIKSLILEGSVPAQGFIVIFGTETFEGMRFSSNKKVGYDEFHFASQAY
jgi:hypothetical protein